MSQTDAERLIVGYIPHIARAPYAIAPERADELNSMTSNSKPWELVFNPGHANFFARPNKSEIEVTFAALLSLWAVARAALLIGNESMAATRSGRSTLNSQPGTAIAEANDLIRAANSLISDPQAAWPRHLAKPNPLAAGRSQDWYVNNLFLGATGWSLLHEVAHVHLKHQEITTDVLRKHQEHEADEWATKWVFEHVGRGLTRDFRVFATATGIVWVGLIDNIRRGSATHPHASDRFIRCSNFFGTNPISPGLELAAHITKVFFDPHAAAPSVDMPQEAFDDALFAYSRLPR